jgi:hypothetical protein
MNPHPAHAAFLEHHPLLGFSLPAEREARFAARRYFVEMKLAFMRAAAEVPGSRGMALQLQVRRAHELADLLVLHKDIFDALPRDGARFRSLREELNRQLDRLFPETQPLGTVGPLL